MWGSGCRHSALHTILHTWLSGSVHAHVRVSARVGFKVASDIDRADPQHATVSEVRKRIASLANVPHFLLERLPNGSGGYARACRRPGTGDGLALSNRPPGGVVYPSPARPPPPLTLVSHAVPVWNQGARNFTQTRLRTSTGMAVAGTRSHRLIRRATCNSSK